jgi:ribosomal protein L11 methyltransferase
MALEYARGNAKRHGVAGRIEFVEDDAVRLMDEPPAVRWDLIAANLFSDLLVTLFPRFPSHLDRGGEVIVSGFLATQAEVVGRSAGKAGLPIRDLVRRGKWMAARCRP